MYIYIYVLCRIQVASFVPFFEGGGGGVTVFVLLSPCAVWIEGFESRELLVSSEIAATLATSVVVLVLRLRL